MKLTKDNIDAVLAEMTLREKATIVVGAGWSSLVEGFHLPFCNGNRVPGAAGETRAIPRLGIPSVVFADGPAGVRMKNPGATAFPTGISLASTADPKLVEEVGRAIGEEARAFGVDVMLTPGMNLMRNPLCGRNYEYFSEDVALSSQMASAIIDGVQSVGVGTSAKHYALNNQETNRFNNNVIIDSVTMHKLYLENFRRALAASKPWTVMASYNHVNGTPVQENKELLTDVLRSQWKYEGVVVTDWHRHTDPVKKIAAGVDLLMPGSGCRIGTIVRAVKRGKLSEERLNEAARRLLELVVKTHSFNQDGGQPFDKAAHQALARKAGAAGCVLLKNEDNTLPISKDAKKIGLLGIHSYHLIAGGTGSGHVNSEHTVSLDEAFKAAGCKLNARAVETFEGYAEKSNARMKVKGMGLFSKHVGYPSFHEIPLISEDTVHNVVDLSDATIITFGRQSGEGVDIKPEKGSYYLSDAEMSLLRMTAARCRAVGKKLIVVLNVAHVIETASWSDMADAILLAWCPGQEAGYAIYDVLTGAVKPQGKLPVTFPVHYEDIPSSANFPTKTCGEKNVRTTRYEEEGNVGHLYFDAHPEVPVAYPFGWGLTY